MFERFYFGCEADDPLTATAFDTDRNPLGARLKPIFASDIGHWDVPDIREVLPEAWEMVEHGHIDEEEFRAFTYENACELWPKSRGARFALGASSARQVEELLEAVLAVRPQRDLLEHAHAARSPQVARTTCWMCWFSSAVSSTSATFQLSAA